MPKKKEETYIMSTNMPSIVDLVVPNFYMVDMAIFFEPPFAALEHL